MAAQLRFGIQEVAFYDGHRNGVSTVAGETFPDGGGLYASADETTLRTWRASGRDYFALVPGLVPIPLLFPGLVEGQLDRSVLAGPGGSH